MSKRSLISNALSIVLLLTLLLPSYAYADGSGIEGVYVNKPQTSVLLDGDADSHNISSVKLNNETLNINSISDYNNSDEYAVAAYVVIDISGSVKSDEALSVFKDELIDYAKSFGADDKFVLYAMGDEAKEILSGGESGDEITSTISGIKRTSQNSYIYNTLDTIYDNSLNDLDYDRRFVLIISDGINYSNSTSYEKIYNKYSSHTLPVYSLLYSDGTITSNRSYVSEFKDLVSDSGGTCISYTETDGTGKLTKLIDAVNNKTVIECGASSNYIDKTVSDNIITITDNEVSINQKNVSVQSNNSDEESPVISEIKYDKDKNSFVITFSENVIVENNSVTISKGDKSIRISAPEVNGNVITLKCSDEIYSGEYTFNFKGVTDESNEKNQLKDSTVTQKIKATSLFVQLIKNFWWIIIIIALMAAIFLILLFLKKKKNVKNIKEIFETQIEVENREVKHTQVVKRQTVPKAASKKLSMIVEHNGSRSRVDVNVVSSIIVGRSDDCEISVEDTKLSRQHFAIEIVNDKFVISDLNTTNGTFVNGTKVISKQLLLAGDKIVAGTSRFIIL